MQVQQSRAMLRRSFLGMACGAFTASMIPVRALHAQGTASRVQVRVYRMPRPGKYEFFGGVQVRLCDGQRGVTRIGSGVTGTVEFKNVSCRQHYAEALINGRWLRSSRSEIAAGSLRLDVVVP